LPDYQVKLEFESSEHVNDDKTSLVAVLKKSKLDYVKSYIDQLDNEALKLEGIDKDKLFAVMQHHYNLATENT